MSDQDTSRYPDIEIYLHDTEPEAILDWLKQRFQSVTPATLEARQGATYHLTVTGEQGPLPATIVTRIPGRFTGLAFASAATPWATDRECALEAFSHFAVEVRCCADSWRTEQDPDEWLRIDASGESLIIWRT